MERVRSQHHSAEQERRQVERALVWSSPLILTLHGWLCTAQEGDRQAVAAIVPPRRLQGKGISERAQSINIITGNCRRVISGEKKFRTEHQRRGGAEIVTFTEIEICSNSPHAGCSKHPVAASFFLLTAGSYFWVST